MEESKMGIGSMPATRTSTARGLILLLPALLCLTSVGLADTAHFDDFSTDTLADYELTILPDSGGGGPTLGNAAALEYDAVNERASVRLEGGYAISVMSHRLNSVLSQDQDFTFSVDVAVFREYTAAIYFGDLGSLANSTYLGFFFDTFAGNGAYVLGYEAGVLTELHNIDLFQNTQNHGTIEMRRQGSAFTFHLDGAQLFSFSNSAFNTQPMHYGVANRITSGPAGVTSLNTFDNWNLQLGSTEPVPEPGSLALLLAGAAGLCVVRRRWRAR